MKNAGREIMTVSTYVINTDGSLSKELTQMHGGVKNNKREKNMKTRRQGEMTTPCEHSASDVCGDERGQRGTDKNGEMTERLGVMKDRQRSE